MSKRDEDLAEVADANRGRLLSIIERTLKDRSEAEDVLQEVLEDYVESYDLGEVIESVSAWLVRVAQNKVLDRFRRKKTRDRYRDAVVQNPVDSFSGEQPDEEFERAWLNSQIVEALEALPPEQRDAFVQNEIEGKTFEQISQETGISINTLLARKRYAVRFLQDYLKEIYNEL